MELQDYKYTDFNIIDELGKGKFGNVCSVTYKENEEKRALKIIDKYILKKDKLTHQIEREIEIHSNINHPNIINFYASFSDDKCIYLLLEYFPSQNLYEFTKRGYMKLEDKLVQNYIRQILLAVEYLHSLQIIHRDLKLENVLVDTNNYIKIIDFGWSVRIKDNEKHKRLCGTLEYLSPEMVMGHEYNENIDIWSIGIIAYELLTGCSPFFCATYQDTYKSIRKIKYEFPTDVDLSEISKDFFKSVFVNSDDRPSASELLKDKYIS